MHDLLQLDALLESMEHPANMADIVLADSEELFGQVGWVSKGVAGCRMEKAPSCLLCTQCRLYVRPQSTPQSCHAGPGRRCTWGGGRGGGRWGRREAAQGFGLRRWRPTCRGKAALLATSSAALVCITVLPRLQLLARHS